MHAVAEELLLGELFGVNDLRRNENGGLASLVRHSNFDERLRKVLLAALEAQASFGHVFAENDVVAVALRMTDASGVVDLDTRVLAAIHAGSSGLFRRGRSENDCAWLLVKFGISGVGGSRR